MMENFYINVDDLQEEEGHYELTLRELPHGRNADNRRLLRSWFRNEDSQECLTLRTIHDEYPVVKNALKRIEELLRTGRLMGCRARLIHYYRRLRRCNAITVDELQARQNMLDFVCKLAKTYLKLDITRIEFLIRFGNPAGDNRSQQSTGQDETADSQRTLITPPGSQVEEEAQIEEAVGGDDLTDPIHEQRVAWAKQVLRDASMGKGSNQTRHSMDSRIPAQNNLQSELQQAARARVSADGVRLPPRSVPISSSFEPGWPDLRFPQPDPMPSRRPGHERTLLDPPMSSNVPFVRHRVDETNHREIPRDRSTRDQPPRENEPSEIRAQNQELNLMEFVHVSEIDRYVQAYVGNLLNHRSDRPLVRDTVVNNLAHQIANVGFEDSELRGISGRNATHHRDHLEGMSRLSPPLQLHRSSENRPREAPQETPVNLRDSGRNSMPFRNRDNHARGPFRPFSSTMINEGDAEEYGRRRLPYQTCNIIEKWPKFSGDSSPAPVVDFLRQVDLLCRSYQVSKEELKTHAHLLFRDDAYTWYTAYETKFDSWDTLLYYLQMRYDNPNRDRFIREEMRNRKQRPNELFSAFMTDIETLSQRLIKRMAEAEKFDIIVENMKMSYKRRLALEKVYSIEHLAQLCYKFDTLEGSLYSQRAQPKAHPINEVVLEKDEEVSIGGDEEEEEEIALLQGGKSKDRFIASEASRNMTTSARSAPLCWNCRKLGHLWRECDQKKTIFCHVCGHPETTAFRCPQQHNIRSASDDKPKND